MKADVVIVGAGPAGIFTAIEMIRKGSKKKIVIVEKGRSVENRRCPKHKTQKCVNCKPYCHITTGFSGAGAFSDGKLSLSSEVGGDLPRLIGEDLAQETIDYADNIYLEFGADHHVEGLNVGAEVKEIRKRAIKAGLKLVDCPIRHMGTEKAHDIYLEIERYLQNNGVEIMFEYECNRPIIKEGVCKGVEIVKADGSDSCEIFAEETVIATGRRGADWLEKICEEYGVEHVASTVDIGVRVEVRNEVMETVNKVLYESKLIGYPLPFKNKVRTFCQNPGGFVSQENYDNNLAVVNGHSFKDVKTENTNVSILCSHNFSHPFNQPIAYAQKIGELTNMLGEGRILVQRFGDILGGKRTWQEELTRSNIRPTLKDAVAGDITAAMPYRTMVNIINFINAVDYVVPGFAAPETLLYSPELKFYSNRIKMDADFNTNIKGLHCLGDSSGWTRGLMMSSVMGVLMGRKLV
ncbi:MAG: FAD-dependent oxidoreductase [Clostridia bacterium]|nr:FAD-dependent oxidoreductase [Clostridia bacterium]